MYNPNPQPFTLIDNTRSAGELITEVLHNIVSHMEAANKLYHAYKEGLASQQDVEETFCGIWTMLTEINNPTSVINLINNLCDKKYHISNYYDMDIIEDGLKEVYQHDEECCSTIHEYFSNFRNIFEAAC